MFGMLLIILCRNMMTQPEFFTKVIFSLREMFHVSNAGKKFYFQMRQRIFFNFSDCLFLWQQIHLSRYSWVASSSWVIAWAYHKRLLSTDRVALSFHRKQSDMNKFIVLLLMVGELTTEEILSHCTNEDVYQTIDILFSVTLGQSTSPNKVSFLLWLQTHLSFIWNSLRSRSEILRRRLLQTLIYKFK